LVASKAAKKRGARSIVRSHNSDFYPNSKGTPQPFVRFLHTKTGAPTLHVYLSLKAEFYAKKNFGNTDSTIAPIGITLEKTEPYKSPGEPCDDGKKVLVTASTIAKVKRIGLVAEVYQHLRNEGLVSKWIHFGSDPHSFFQSLPESFSADSSIECKGELPNSTFRQQLRQVSNGFFLNLSSSEGMPVTILEAGVSGLPVAATNVGVVSDLISDATGLLIPIEDSAQEVASQIVGWLKSPALEAQKQNLERSIREKYDSKITTQKFLDSVRALLSGTLS
jgi:glycosyltransferase involved in cell wall biosynthesis